MSNFFLAFYIHNVKKISWNPTSCFLIWFTFLLFFFGNFTHLKTQFGVLDSPFFWEFAHTHSVWKDSWKPICVSWLGSWFPGSLWSLLIWDLRKILENPVCVSWFSSRLSNFFLGILYPMWSFWIWVSWFTLYFCVLRKILVKPTSLFCFLISLPFT